MPKIRPSKEKISAVAAERLAPLFALDRGRIEIVRYSRKTGCVHVRLGGSYRGSPCRGTLIQYVIAPVLKEVFTEIKSVALTD